MGMYIMEESAIAHNTAIMQEVCGDTAIWGVVKGNGYGLGTVALARVLASQGIHRFAVGELTEVRALRQAGFRHEPILMLRGTSDAGEVRELLELGAILTITSLDDLEAASICGIPGQAHVEIDTGLGRFGFLPQEIETVLKCYHAPKLFITGIYTHFAAAYSRRKTKKQFRIFMQVVNTLRSRGVRPGMIHCCNSSACWLYPEMRCDAVRLGSALLGRVAFREAAGLLTAGYCLGQVTELRSLPRRHNVGYNGNRKTWRTTETAVLDVGYAQGFGLQKTQGNGCLRDCLRGIAHTVKGFLVGRKLYVTFRGQRCRVLGQVGMNTTIVDVTDCPCALGEYAVIELSPLYQKNLPVLPEMLCLHRIGIGEGSETEKVSEWKEDCLSCMNL